MSEALSTRDPRMVEIGILLADMSVAENRDVYYAPFYNHYLLLTEKHDCAVDIAKALLIFIKNNPNHPAYEKLHEILNDFPGEEPTTSVHDRMTVPTPLNVQEVQSAMNEEVDALLQQTDPADAAPYRRSSPTLVDNRELNDVSPHDRDTLIPEEILPQKKDS